MRAKVHTMFPIFGTLEARLANIPLRCVLMFNVVKMNWLLWDIWYYL